MRFILTGCACTAAATVGAYVDVGGQWGVSATVPPLSANTSWGGARVGGTIAVGDDAAPEVPLFSRDGAKRVVRWDDEPEPIVVGEVSEWIERQRSAEWTQSRLLELERDASADWVLGIYRDQSEVEFVRLYRISALAQ
jgi:hypothetical protein